MSHYVTRDNGRDIVIYRLKAIRTKVRRNIQKIKSPSEMFRRYSFKQHMHCCCAYSLLILYVELPSRLI